MTGRTQIIPNVYQKNTAVASLTASQKFRLEQVPTTGGYLLRAMCSSNGTNRVVDIQRVGTKPTAGKLDIKYQEITELGDNMDKFGFSFDLDTELRYTSVLPCSLSLHGNDLMSGCNREITSLIVTSDEIIVITDTPDEKYPDWDVPRTECVKNVFAFDYTGKEIWDFDTLVGEKHYPIIGGFIADDEHKRVYSEFFNVPIVPSHRYFVATTFVVEYYIIDLTERKFVKRIAYKT